MIKKWFKRMFLAMLFDSDIRKELLEAIEYEKHRIPPPPRPNKYATPFS